MTEIQGLEGLAQNVTEIDLDAPSEDVAQNGASPLAAVPEPDLDALHEPELDALHEPEQNDLKITLQVGDGAEHDVTSAFKSAANGELFDSGSYVDVPVIDGQATDALVIAFGGSIKYEASDRAGQDLFNDLRLGKSVTLRVEGVVVDKKGGYKVNAAEEEIVTGTARIKVETLYLPGPSEL